MSGFTRTGVTAHDSACILAEGVRQAAVAGVTTNAAAQVAANNAEIAFRRAVIGSCKVNNNSQGIEPYINTLKALGTGGLCCRSKFPRTLGVTAMPSKLEELYDDGPEMRIERDPQYLDRLANDPFHQNRRLTSNAGSQ